MRSSKPASRRARLWFAGLALCGCAALGGGACAAVPAAPSRLSASHGDVPGIAWFDGDVAAAFTAAAAQHKPVFLYWGAKWCPPCQQLKSSVFSRSDFIDKSKQFVAVYLDGDDAGAQRWGDKFQVSGYPTVILLRADRAEIARISGGLDLSLYADLLDVALNDTQPMDAVLAGLRRQPAQLTHGVCQRLAFYAWDLRDIAAGERDALAGELRSAAALCGDGNSLEAARLRVVSASLRRSDEAVDDVIAIVENPAVAARVADALEGLDEEFLKSIRAREAMRAATHPAPRAAFATEWSRVMDEVADDPRLIDADRLAALAAKLAAIKIFADDARVPAVAAKAARARVAAVLAQRQDPYVRAGIVNAASAVYESLGDPEDTVAEHAMLVQELDTAKAPYYYMADLAALEEKRGDKTAALSWFERAYAGSTGVATRFQWGVMYLSALLRLSPDDRTRITHVGAQVIEELDGPARIQARTRSSLARLSKRLSDWNQDHRHDAAIKTLHARMQEVCRKLPRTDPGRDTCRRFLETPAAA